MAVSFKSCATTGAITLGALILQVHPDDSLIKAPASFRGGLLPAMFVQHNRGGR